MDNLGQYELKPFTKQRKNIALVTQEGKRKRSFHTLLEFDVTTAHTQIKTLKEKKGIDISFTGWMIKCISQALSEHKELNSYRFGFNKMIVFDDVDVATPIERKVGAEYRPRALIIRKAQSKTVEEITLEIRTAQNEDIGDDAQILGRKLSLEEKLMVNAPTFLQKMVLYILRGNGRLKKKYMGTIGVTAIGMKGVFPGWVIAAGGPLAGVVAIGGITKKPGVVQDKIKIREYLHVSITFDHDIVDGGPMVRFVQRLTELLENGYGLPDIKKRK
jgi:pyruvate/2-oxoglutarate dehydrogenase complex dihydrolipoamide acyltransferase (E2) component